MIYKIARAELWMLFCSPIAWLLLLCFVVQMGLRYIYLFNYLMYSMKEYGGVWNATKSLFLEQNGTWCYVLEFLYFYIPLLTMGMVSKEFNSGSIRLLYSSPISSTQIILGKYFALIFYAFVLMGVLAIYAFIGWATIKNFEVGLVWTGLGGLFLLTCTYLAVGLFVSSLTSYQIISAVGTFMVLMLLSMVSKFGQQFDFVREVTYWLSIDGRADTFLRGMICSEDLLYFPVVSSAFLALTVIRLNAVRQKQRFVITLGKNMVVLVVVAVIAYTSSQPALTGYYDTTSTKENTLTPISQEIMKEVEGRVTITSYVNILDKNYWEYPYPRFIMENIRFFRNYTRFKPDIKLNTIYYYAEPDDDIRKEDLNGNVAWEKARHICERYDIDSSLLKSKEEIDEIVDLSEEGYTFIREIVRENGQRDWLRVYNDGVSRQPTEAEITVAFKRMILEMPKIGFVTGHGERGMYDRTPYGYQYIASNKKVKSSVWNQGFDVEEVVLDKEVAKDIDIIIIADPREEFSKEEESFLQSYLNRGGNLFILGEPRHREVLNPMLQNLFGLELTPLLVQNDVRYKVLPANILTCISTEVAKNKMYQLSYSNFVMPTVAGIEQVEDKGFDLFPVAQSDTITSCWTELETTDFVDDTIRFNSAIGEVSKVFSTVVGLTRMVGEKEQRIMISGDADIFMNDEFVTRRGVSSNNDYLLLGGCHWMSYGKAPIDVRRPKTQDNKVYLSADVYPMLRWGIRWGIPILVLIGGVWVWLRRRGR